MWRVSGVERGAVPFSGWGIFKSRGVGCWERRGGGTVFGFLQKEMRDATSRKAAIYCMFRHSVGSPPLMRFLTVEHIADNHDVQ